MISSHLCWCNDMAEAVLSKIQMDGSNSKTKSTNLVYIFDHNIKDRANLYVNAATAIFLYTSILNIMILYE